MKSNTVLSVVDATKAGDSASSRQEHELGNPSETRTLSAVVGGLLSNTAELGAQRLGNSESTGIHDFATNLQVVGVKSTIA